MENVMLLVDSGVVRYCIASLSVSVHVRIQRGGDRGSGTPLKNHKNIEFSSNTGSDQLKICSYQASIIC